MTYIQENKLSTKINFEWVRRLYLVDKDFKAGFIKCSKNSKKLWFKNVRKIY